MRGDFDEDDSDEDFDEDDEDLDDDAGEEPDEDERECEDYFARCAQELRASSDDRTLPPTHAERAAGHQAAAFFESFRSTMSRA